MTFAHTLCYLAAARATLDSSSFNLDVHDAACQTRDGFCHTPARIFAMTYDSSFSEQLLATATDLSSSLGLLAQSGGGGAFSGMLPMFLIFAIFYFLVLRPQSTQEKERKKRVDSVEKGTQVVLTGGIIGRVSSLGDDGIAVVELADKVKIRVLRKDISDLLDDALAAQSKGAAKSKGESSKAKNSTGKKAEKGGDSANAG